MANAARLFLASVSLAESKFQRIRSALRSISPANSKARSSTIALKKASLLAVTKAGAQIRRAGSTALDLAYVAAGRFYAFFEVNLKPWDIAAGELLVREAGGTVVDARGGQDSLDNGQVLACSLKLLKPLMKTVVPAWGDAVKSK